MVLSRRELVRTGAGASLAAARVPHPVLARASDPLPAPGPFDGATVRRLAQAMARHPYQPPDERLPAAVGAMDFDQYRGIRFRKDDALWRGRNSTCGRSWSGSIG